MTIKGLPAVLAAALLLLVCLSACQAAEQSTAGAGGTQAAFEQGAEARSPDTALAEEPDDTGETMIYAHVGESVLVIRPENNSSAEAFLELLANGDLTIAMHDYGGFEKVGPLGTSLPTNEERITTEPGDVILYQGNQITIYYGTNTWTFTRLGKVQGMTPDEIREALGAGDPTVVFSLG